MTIDYVVTHDVRYLKEKPKSNEAMLFSLNRARLNKYVVVTTYYSVLGMHFNAATVPRTNLKQMKLLQS